MNHRYRNYTIVRNPKPIHTSLHDWDFVHDDYDGPEDPRCGTAFSLNDACNQIDEIEENNDE